MRGSSNGEDEWRLKVRATLSTAHREERLRLSDRMADYSESFLDLFQGLITKQELWSKFSTRSIEHQKELPVVIVAAAILVVNNWEADFVEGDEQKEAVLDVSAQVLGMMVDLDMTAATLEKMGELYHPAGVAFIQKEIDKSLPPKHRSR